MGKPMSKNPTQRTKDSVNTASGPAPEVDPSATIENEIELPEGANLFEDQDGDGVNDLTEQIELPEGAAQPDANPVSSIDPESKAAKKAAAAAERAAKRAELVGMKRYCLCGCGSLLKGTKTNFAVGHDMKVKKAILDNLRTGALDLFAGITPQARDYVNANWGGYILKAIDLYIGKPVNKTIGALGHYNKLHYLTFLAAPSDTQMATSEE
jgi:hypothetical protein